MIPRDLLQMFHHPYQRLILGDLEELVEFESPSGDRIALEQLKGLLIDRLKMLKASVRTEFGRPECQRSKHRDKRQALVPRRGCACDGVRPTLV